MPLLSGIWPGGERVAGLDEFVAGGEDRDARALADRELFGAAHDRGGDRAGGEAGSGGDERRSGRKIAGARADMLARLDRIGRRQAQCRAFGCHIFLNDHRIGAIG